MKRKINIEDNSDCNSKLTTLSPNYGKVGSSSKIVDYSNNFAVANIPERLDESKFGSVTKEYEALHAQRMQVINFLSALQPSIASLTKGGTSTCSDQSTRKNQTNLCRFGDNLSCEVIDLEDDTMAGSTSPVKILAGQTQEAVNNISQFSNGFDSESSQVGSPPANEEGKVQTAVIILDSDEEDESHQIRNKHSSQPGQDASVFRSLLTSEIQKHLSRANKLAQESNLFQLVPYDQRVGKSHAITSFKSNWQPSVQYEKVVLQTVDEKQRFQDVVDESSVQMRSEREDAEAPNTVMNMVSIHKTNLKELHASPEASSNIMVQDVPNAKLKRHHASVKASPPTDVQEKSCKAVQENSSMDVQESSCMGSFDEDDKRSSQSDGLEDLWKDMSLAMEYSKVDTSDDQAVVQEELLEEEEEECNHSFLLQDDLGLYCRICGVIQKSIETIFDFQWTKGPRTTRTYLSMSRNPKDLDEEIQNFGPKVAEDDFVAAEVSIHPRHLKQMKPHQLEGFNFLVKNLVAEKPGGCILAHAPGSGKTFMLISFIQSFLAKYPSKKPLVVLPKGILPIWKKELQRWQIEDLPVYDFYSVKADNRSQQLEVLKLWQENKSILFLGYKQFSNIISDKDNSKVSAACREILLKVPGLLILDEGHTPRNEETYMLDSLAKVQTLRKVVLSGTLFQNHVREVFNILNLVRPKFLKTEHSRAIVKRVMSRVRIPGCKKLANDSAFFELVEETLQNDENFKRKVTVIQDLRELTKDVLHYYKGDFLEELPGLVDFTVLLNLGGKQKATIQNLAKFEKFKRTSLASAVYIHPDLYDTAEMAPADRATVTSFKDDKIDRLLGSINVRDGAKANFFLNILSLAESAGEKLLAFSKYLLPLRFLERLIVKTKGWRTGKEIFMICGDSSADERERYMDQFNNSPDAKVFFGSIKACGEGISLVGASRVIILDVHLNPSVTCQAIGRAFRPGQTKKVYTYRLVAADSPEEEDHHTSFNKELTSKMWFEWTEYHKHQDFALDEVNKASCEDLFLESPLFGEDIKAVYRR
ncbi:hypothetical protein Cni_G02975 [Canna indica]|uniref:Uncharacterized protein n=1 Tax=Canna indica TaxID=4628 RepID=A0AAQ3JRQ3_9LILI|nr:hypothetical protein Cni_G02975 [Canna indica]